jgi:hypothetical protein
MTDEEKTAKLEDCLADAGKMGALMRNSFGVASLTFDWSKILLDPVGSLLQSWLTAVSLVRASRLPMLIYWEPELAQFYKRPLAKVELTPLNPPETGGRNLTLSPFRGGLGRGFKDLCKRYNNGFCPILGDLKHLGVLRQPHTLAGQKFGNCSLLRMALA